VNGKNMIFIDVDGTLTDGKIYYSSRGDELKIFNIKDGLIMSAMRKIGYEFVIVTGRISPIIDKRMKELGITNVFQGVLDKQKTVDDFLKENSYKHSDCAYIGDDLNDLSIMMKMGWSACPQDSCDEVKEIVDYVSSLNGGCGAVRQILEEYLKSRGNKSDLVKLFL